jgi:hypothetical protein
LAFEADPMSSWEQAAKLLAEDGAFGDELGQSASISGDVALVGAPSDDDNDRDSGAAYVFVRNGDVWKQQAKLLASDGAVSDNFGLSVSLSGATALIGAPFANGNGSSVGAAYVFVRSGEEWMQQAKLLASDGAAVDAFGTSVSLSEDTALIGVPGRGDNGFESGAAYVFLRSGELWTQEAKLLASDGAGGDDFGTSVSVSGDTALIGAPGTDDNGSGAGSAYVFARRDRTWTQQAEIMPDDGTTVERFGTCVAVSGDTALFGLPHDGDNGHDSGSAYVFVRSGEVWTQLAKLLPSDVAFEDHFGWSVSIWEDLALIGASWDADNGAESGSAYIFVRSDGVWTEGSKLLASDGEDFDYLGWSVSISKGTALIGARGDGDNGAFSGAAYVFDSQLLFADGFESGDTSAWSGTVP